MEDWLEKYRFQATFNFGESGGPIRTVRDLFTLSNHTLEDSAEQIFSVTLNDSPNWGHPELRKLVSDLHPRTTSENVLITTGTSEALFLLFRQLMPKKIALAWPAFQLLYEIPQKLGAKIVPLPVHWDSQFKPFVDEDEWLKILHKEKPDCLLINHPHNPSGYEFSPSFLQKIVDFCENHSVTLIGDEHYRFLSSQKSPLGFSLLDFSSSSKSNIFITGSFIKCIGCPGLRIGWCVGNPHTLSLMQNEKNYTTHTVNPVTELISRIVLRNLSSPIWNETRKIWNDNRSHLDQWLQNSPSWHGHIPSGGWVTTLSTPFTQTNVGEQLTQKSVFLLPLHSMEFPTIHNYQAFRLGLGAFPKHFKNGLEFLNFEKYL